MLCTMYCEYHAIPGVARMYKKCSIGARPADVYISRQQRLLRSEHLHEASAFADSCCQSWSCRPVRLRLEFAGRWNCLGIRASLEPGEMYFLDVQELEDEIKRARYVQGEQDSRTRYVLLPLDLPRRALTKDEAHVNLAAAKRRTVWILGARATMLLVADHRVLEQHPDPHNTQRSVPHDSRYDGG